MSACNGSGDGGNNGGRDDLSFTIDKVNGELRCGGLHVLDVVAAESSERKLFG